MKLTLGTAQFGRKYGIANKIGKVPYDDVLKILSLASNNGIVCVDTSNDYGSEKIIGQAAEELGIKLKITTKLYREFDKECPSEIINGVECMIERLRTNCVDSLLIHDPYWLQGKTADYVYGMLMVLKGKGYTKKIGVSVNEPKQAVEIFDNYNLDVAQVPFNLLDQRLIDNNVIDRLLGKEIHIRSVFLQGLLLMDPKTLSEYFNPIKDKLSKLRDLADDRNVSMLKMCLDFATSIFCNKVIIGVDSQQQLQDILNAYNSPKCTVIPYGSYINNDKKFINPSFWPEGGWLDEVR